MADTKLKPCPFCGGEDIQQCYYDPYDGYQGDLGRYITRCSGCGAEIERRHKSESTEAWNRRANDG